MNEGAKGVTQRILDRHIIYGASDNTQPGYASANKSLNYHTGGSISSPELNNVSIVPFTLNYRDTVGLFGQENHFIKVNINIDKNAAYACFEEEGWQCAVITEGEASIINTYLPAIVDPKLDLEVVNTYEPAGILANTLATKADPYISIDLENLKTGNKYIDAWFDVRLYNKAREEHPYDKMYVRLNDYFYIGFHARNTRRLPYNVKCVIGQEYLSGLEAGSMRYTNR